MTVSELGERALLARIQAILDATSRASASVVVGIGDDAAVVTATRNAQLVMTTDAQIEGVHFERRFSTGGDIGHRALAVNLSDLAAMGATPRWALLSLGLPDTMAVADVEELVTGVAQLARRHSVDVIGGNQTRSPGSLLVDMVAVGEVAPRRALTRSGGRPGDELWVSGTIGGAAAGLAFLQAGGDTGTRNGQTEGTAGMSECVARYRRPEPRVRLGKVMAQARAARAAMDLSDGLADAASQLAAASGCGVELDADALPIEPAARDWWRAAGKDGVLEALSGGDDYELLFAVPRVWGGRLRHARARVAEPGLTRIGVLTKERNPGVLVRGGRREALPRGFEHF